MTAEENSTGKEKMQAWCICFTDIHNGILKLLRLITIFGLMLGIYVIFDTGKNQFLIGMHMPEFTTQQTFIFAIQMAAWLGIMGIALHTILLLFQEE